MSDARPGDLLLVALDEGRFGGLHLLSITPERAQVAVLDTIWDCRPDPADVAYAMDALQVRVPRARLDAAEPCGAARPVSTLASTALVDAPLTALFSGLIATAL